VGDPSLSVLTGLWRSYTTPSDTIQRKSVVLSHRHCSGRQLSCELLLSKEYYHVVRGSKEPASRVIPGVIHQVSDCNDNGERTRKARFLLVLHTLQRLFTAVHHGIDLQTATCLHAQEDCIVSIITDE